MTHSTRKLVNATSLCAGLAIFAGSAHAATLAEYDLVDYSVVGNRASEVDPANATASSYLFGTDTGFSDGTDSHFANLAVYEPYASFTVTADSGFELNLDTFIFNYAAANSLTATESYTINAVVNGATVYTDTVVGTGEIKGFSSGLIDLSGAAFQGLSSATVEITVSAVTAGELDTDANEIRIVAVGSNDVFDPPSNESNFVLTGTVVPEPGSLALLGLGGLLIARRRRS